MLCRGDKERYRRYFNTGEENRYGTIWKKSRSSCNGRSVDGGVGYRMQRGDWCRSDCCNGRKGKGSAWSCEFLCKDDAGTVWDILCGDDGDNCRRTVDAGCGRWQDVWRVSERQRDGSSGKHVPHLTAFRRIRSRSNGRWERSDSKSGGAVW